jgi:heat shock protein HtpX
MSCMARTSSFGKDTGLQTRMLVTMFLLGALYAALVAALFASGASGITILLVAGGLLALQLFTSDKIALRAMGVHEVSPQQAPELHAMIERLCIQADLPKPRIGVMESQMPNAFAMGRSKKAATVCATTGIMELLSPAELEGVMAHELSHIANRDVAIMTMASFFASLASMIVYVISFFLIQTLSRYREFAADRGSAIITGRPSALASALLKIAGTMERVPQQDLRAHAEMNAFYIFPAGAKASLFNLFSTHPPLEKRIAALQRLESQLQQGGGAALAPA